MEKRVYVHNTSELIVMAEKETGSFYICYRGTTTLKDALRDVTFLAVDPLAHTSKEGDGMNELGLPRAIASCLSPKRLCHRRMHRGFATRSIVHNPYLLSGLLELTEGDLSKIKRLYFTGHS